MATWIATEGNWASFRLSLDENGTGLFGATYHDEPTMLYRIRSWRLGESLRIKKGEPDRLRELTIILEPISGARPLQMSGWAGRSHLRLRLDWEGWSSREVILYREDVISPRAQRTREKMAEHDSQ